MRNDKTNVIVEKSVAFSLSVIQFTEVLEHNRKFVIAKQLLRSATSIGANIFEAQNAESRADFIHKMKVVLKEIRESRVNLKIICRKPIVINEKTEHCLKEANELMAIFMKSIDTAKKNLSASKTK